jgi:prepilin-type N-terminal cleavage/methylation domain-containing protein
METIKMGIIRIDRVALLKSNGFTLVELAVVVAVIALLLGSLLVPLTSQVEQRNITHTQRQLEEVREALLGFAIVNGRLPRPARSETDGVELAGPCTDARDCTGYIPWVTLGVPKADAWGKMLGYSVVPQYANSTFTFDTGGTLKTVLTRQPDGSTANLATNLVAVVISYGSKNWGKGEDGTDIADNSGTNLDEDANHGKFHCTVVSDCTDFVSRSAVSAPSAPGGEFDDLLVWVPQALVLSRLVAAGKLP